MHSIKELSGSELHSRLKEIKSKENSVTAEVVLHLHEMDTRGYYRDLGYSSLFVYCTSGLGYSEGAAMRRIQAARILETEPQVYQKISDGSLSLCAVAEIARIKDEEQKAQVLAKAEGKSKREVEKLVSPLLPPSKPRRETIRVKHVQVDTSPLFKDQSAAATSGSTPKVEERYSLSVELDQGTYELLNRAKEISGNIPLNDLLKRVLRKFVNSNNKIGSRKRKNSESTVLKNPRYIPASVKKEVKERDGGQCSYKSLDGTRCSERCGLEYEHIVPYAMGGTATGDNQQLLCRAHNQLRAEETFGKELMEQFKSQ